MTLPAWETATIAWASAMVMFITDAPYQASVGHAMDMKPMAASSDKLQNPEDPEGCIQTQTLFALHVELVFNGEQERACVSWSFT